MACNFSIPFSGTPLDVLRSAKSAVVNQGGSFDGDTGSGSFQLGIFGSNIKGSYTVDGQNLNITIDSKPFILPCSTIESFLKSQIR
jgi:hypothetical protein